MQRTLLIAIGGNALLRQGETASIAAERTRIAETCRTIAAVLAQGWRAIITHGNGPQVGAALLRSELAALAVYPMPLDVCVAATQGEIGYLLQQALLAEMASRDLHRPICTVVTQVVVRPDDPAFAHPTKPIGPDRRVVASPEPCEVVEEAVIRQIVDTGAVVITAGGGGIPVVREGHRLTGIEAVIDKDLSSALLATRLGVDRLVMSTDVDRVYLDFGTARARGLDRVAPAELRRYAADGHFPPGTMGPKVEAALRFVEAGGVEAIVTAHDGLEAALEGRAGTHVTRTGAGSPADKEIGN